MEDSKPLSQALQQELVNEEVQNSSSFFYGLYISLFGLVISLLTALAISKRKKLQYRTIPVEEQDSSPV
jgi:DNA phosphorothioation-dependent restriction protein DptG